MKYPAFLLDLSSGSARTVEDEPEGISNLHLAGESSVTRGRYGWALGTFLELQL
jgi:hypothetical protein